jgi:hypothetical protein
MTFGHAPFLRLASGNLMAAIGFQAGNLIVAGL